MLDLQVIEQRMAYGLVEQYKWIDVRELNRTLVSYG